MFAIEYLIAASLAMAISASGCHKHWYQMCCIANYNLIIPATACVPLSSMPAGLNGNPYCGNLIGIDTTTTWFETCCNYAAEFSQTCSTVNGGNQTCSTSPPGIKCTDGGID